MNKVKKTIASVGLALGLVVGTGAAAMAATTYTDVKYVGNYTYEVWKTVDYNWWEETFQGKRDYKYFSHYKYCPPGTWCVF